MEEKCSLCGWIVRRLDVHMRHNHKKIMKKFRMFGFTRYSPHCIPYPIVNTSKNNVNIINKNVITINNDVNTINNDVNTINNDVNTINNDVITIDEESMPPPRTTNDDNISRTWLSSYQCLLTDKNETNPDVTLVETDYRIDLCQESSSLTKLNRIKQEENLEEWVCSQCEQYYSRRRRMGQSNITILYITNIHILYKINY